MADFVSDNVEYIVAGLVVAILLLLLVISIVQRRSNKPAMGNTAMGSISARPSC